MGSTLGDVQEVPYQSWQMQASAEFLLCAKCPRKEEALSLQRKLEPGYFSLSSTLAFMLPSKGLAKNTDP